MNIQEAKNIRLIDFYPDLGYNPVIQRGNDVWYKCGISLLFGRKGGFL